MDDQAYRQLAPRIRRSPQRLPPDRLRDRAGRIAARATITPAEAQLAARLRLTLESPDQIASRTGLDLRTIRPVLKSMARRDLIAFGKGETTLGYGALPFVVGIYEMQVGTIDQELAQLFEDYHHQSFHQALAQQPPVHRVIPVGESLRTDIENPAV